VTEPRPSGSGACVVTSPARRGPVHRNDSNEMDAAISRFLVPTLRPGGSHSSRPAIADGLQQPTRKSSGSGQAILPYLVLLRVGFSLPLRLPATRCALTAPFHPYLRIRRSAGGIFSVALIRRTGFEPAPPAVNRHAALWRPDFASHTPERPLSETLTRPRDCLPAPISSPILPWKPIRNPGTPAHPAAGRLHKSRQRCKPSDQPTPGRHCLSPKAVDAYQDVA